MFVVYLALVEAARQAFEVGGACSCLFFLLLQAYRDCGVVEKVVSVEVSFYGSVLFTFVLFLFQSERS